VDLFVIASEAKQSSASREFWIASSLRSSQRREKARRASSYFCRMSPFPITGNYPTTTISG
jgi:hypothetical protein